MSALYHVSTCCWSLVPILAVWGGLFQGSSQCPSSQSHSGVFYAVSGPSPSTEIFLMLVSMQFWAVPVKHCWSPHLRPWTSSVHSSQPWKELLHYSTLCAAITKGEELGGTGRKTSRLHQYPQCLLAFQPSWSLIFLGRRWQDKEAWNNHPQLKTESTNMPKSGKHKLPRGLLGKQEHFNMANTFSCEVSIRNRFGIWEITLFLTLCPFNEGKGPGCDNVVTNELHLPVLHLAKENKEEKWCSSYFRGSKEIK